MCFAIVRFGGFLLCFGILRNRYVAGRPFCRIKKYPGHDPQVTGFTFYMCYSLASFAVYLVVEAANTLFVAVLFLFFLQNQPVHFSLFLRLLDRGWCCILPH